MSLSLIEELPRSVREGKAEVARIMERLSSQNRLARVEYWPVAANYDGKAFRSKWLDYRESRSGDADEHLITKSVTLIVSKAPCWRRACVKAVDMFRFENVVAKEVKG